MDENKYTYVHVLISKEVKEELVKEAEKRQLALATYIRQILLDRKKVDE